MKNHSGFIQIPLLVAIIAGVLILGGGGYLGVKQYRKLQDIKTAEEKQQSEEMEKLKREVTELKNGVGPEKTQERDAPIISSAKPKSQQKTNPITHTAFPNLSQLSKYLTGVGRLQCYDGLNYAVSKNVVSGTGFLGRGGGEFLILTNQHISKDFDSCDFFIPPAPQSAPFDSESWLVIRNIQKGLVMTPGIDFASIEISGAESLTPIPRRIDELNYQITDLNLCSEEIPIGTPLYTIGYPAYGDGSRIILEGHISGYTTEVTWKTKNYFVSNRIDGGNSGSPAIAFENGKFCLAGLVTWLTVGNYETQGVVQNIHNIFGN